MSHLPSVRAHSQPEREGSRSDSLGMAFFTEDEHQQFQPEADSADLTIAAFSAGKWRQSENLSFVEGIERNCASGCDSLRRYFLREQGGSGFHSGFS